MYRKITADHIFTGHEILPVPAVLITDASGVIVDMVDNKDAGDDIETFKGLLSPGFINAHCHLELSHLKGMIPQKSGLVNFVQQVMGSRASPAQLKLEAMINAEAEMLQNGIVAVGDICNTADSIAVKRTSKLSWHNFIETSGFVDAAAPKRFAFIKNVLDQFKTTGSKHSATLSPHAPYSVSKKLFQLLNDETQDQLITIHNQECAAENDLYKYKTGGFLKLYKNFAMDISSFEATGKSGLQSWLPYFTKHQSIISVHNTFTTSKDLAFANHHAAVFNNQIFFCLCINANLYIEQKIPPIDLLMKSGCDIVIGTDSYASNLQLNILEEIKTIQQQTQAAIPLQALLQWATINGAKALQMDGVLGSFEKGKIPGVVLIEKLNDLQTTPQSFARRII